MTRFRPVRLWWARQHDCFRVSWCWQCRLGRRRGGGFYEHDEPAWLIREHVAERSFGCGLAPRAATYWWTPEDGLRRWTS